MELHRARLLGNTSALFDAFFADAAKASRRIWVECFIVRADKLGQLLADALAEAAARGVDARLLYDPMGCRVTDPAFFRELAARGVKVLPYGHAVSHQSRRNAGGSAAGVPSWEVWNPVRVPGQIARLWPRARNHSRIYVLDDAGYTGGHAWGDEWLPAARGGQGWQDVCCRVEGPVVEDMAQLFERRCLEASGTPSMLDFDTEDRYPDVRFISDAPAHTSLLYYAYLEAFARARSRIWLANSYCFPPRDMLRTLREAAGRGVDVRLILPGESDIPLIRRAARAEYPDWIEAGFHIWEYQHTVMHAKYALCDDQWSSIGTFNANAASLSVSIETALICRDRDFNARVAKQFEIDLQRSTPVGTEEISRLGWRERAFDALAHAAMSIGDALLDPTPKNALPRPASPRPEDARPGPARSVV